MRLGYLPQSSPIHRLNPLTKFAWLCSLGILSFVVPRPHELVAVLAMVVITAEVARILRPWMMFMRLTILPAVAITLLNVLMSPYHGDRMVFASYSGTNDVLLHYEYGVFSLTVTAFGLQKGVFLGLRWLSLVAPAGVFAYTTRPEDFAAALSRIRIPYTIAFAIGAALRLLPTLVEDAQTIVQAQRARGLDWDRRLMGSARALPAIAFPLIACSIRRATEMAAAMEARAYGARERTVCYPTTFGAGDVWWLVAVVVMLALGVLSRSGPR